MNFQIACYNSGDTYTWAHTHTHMHICYAMAVKGLKMFQGSKRLYQGTEPVQMHKESRVLNLGNKTVNDRGQSQKPTISFILLMWTVGKSRDLQASLVVLGPEPGVPESECWGRQGFPLRVISTFCHLLCWWLHDQWL